MKIISIANKKGGVGKTTFTTNLAMELARFGYSILLLDMDAQCDLSKTFASKAKLRQSQRKGNPNIRGVLEGRCSLIEAIVKAEEGIHLVLGDKSLENYRGKDGTMFLEKGLASKKLKGFDFVLVDYPPQTNRATISALSLTDYVLIVTEAESLSINNLDEYINELLKLKRKINLKLKIIGLVANKVDMRRNLTKKKLKELAKLYTEYFFEDYVSTDTAIPLSMDRRMPVRMLEYRSRTVSQFQRIAEEMLKRTGA